MADLRDFLRKSVEQLTETVKEEARQAGAQMKVVLEDDLRKWKDHVLHEKPPGRSSGSTAVDDLRDHPGRVLRRLRLRNLPSPKLRIAEITHLSATDRMALLTRFRDAAQACGWRRQDIEEFDAERLEGWSLSHDLLYRSRAADRDLTAVRRYADHGDVVTREELNERAREVDWRELLKRPEFEEISFRYEEDQRAWKYHLAVRTSAEESKKFEDEAFAKRVQAAHAWTWRGMCPECLHWEYGDDTKKQIHCGRELINVVRKSEVDDDKRRSKQDVGAKAVEDEPKKREAVRSWTWKGMCPQCRHWFYWDGDERPLHCGSALVNVTAPAF